MPPADDSAEARASLKASLALAALLARATCSALSPIWVRVSETGPTAAAFRRVALASPALWLLHRLVRGSTLPAAVPWKLLLAAGIAFAGDLAVWHTSIKLASVANSTLLAVKNLRDHGAATVELIAVTTTISAVLLRWRLPRANGCCR